VVPLLRVFGAQVTIIIQGLQESWKVVLIPFASIITNLQLISLVTEVNPGIDCAISLIIPVVVPFPLSILAFILATHCVIIPL
jgi:hypothetical protein